MVPEAATSTGGFPAEEERFKGCLQIIQGQFFQVRARQTLEIGGAAEPQLVLVNTVAHQAQLRHVGAGTAVGAAGHPHQQGLLNLEPSQLGIEAIQNIRKDALRFGDGEPAGG